MRDYQSISNTLSKTIETTGQVKSRNLAQTQKLIDEISLMNLNSSNLQMYIF